ncbi:hypothetical protein [Phormidium nigroviride]
MTKDQAQYRLSNLPQSTHKKEEGRRKKEEGRGKKEEGRRKKEKGRRKEEEGRRKREEDFLRLACNYRNLMIIELTHPYSMAANGHRKETIKMAVLGIVLRKL